MSKETYFALPIRRSII